MRSSSAFLYEINFLFVNLVLKDKLNIFSRKCQSDYADYGFSEKASFELINNHNFLGILKSVSV